MKEPQQRQPQEPSRRYATTSARQPQSDSGADGAMRESDDSDAAASRASRSTPDVTLRPDGVAFCHKFLKRPRSPQQQPPPPSRGFLPPIAGAGAGAGAGANAGAGASAGAGAGAGAAPTAAAAAAMPVQERQERQLRAFLRHFLADESGRLARDIDLQQHALDSGVAVTDATVQAVVSALPAVRGLRLAGCAQVTDAGVWAIARQCAELEAIDLAQCERVTELGLRLLAHHCPALVSVDLSDCPQVTDSALQTLAAGCWRLQTLVLARCRRVSDAGVAKVAQCCKDLRRLDVSECERVGEFGDQALAALGRGCPQLAELDLFGCRHVHDAGVRAVAKGCPRLTTLKLSGCRSVSSAAIRALASQCRALQTLSLAGCVQTTNDDLRALAAALGGTLRWLDISGSPRVDVRGVRALAQSCTGLTYLSLASCERVGDAALEELATGNGTATALATLSLADCPRVTEAGVATLAAACANLTTLDVTGCAQIGRRFLQALVARLEVVEWATAFFGFQPLPHAAELCRQRDRRRLELRSCVAIQAAMRGCLARGGLGAARRRAVEARVLPKLQARVRGAFVRRALAREQRHALEDRAARVIGREWRSLQLRRLLARATRLRRIRTSEDAAARVFQRLFRGHQGRARVRAVRDAVRQQRQLDARVITLRELAAARLQRLYRGHRGRHTAALADAVRAAQRRLAESERNATLMLQRMVRGRGGRQLRAQRLAELAHERRRGTGAVALQKVFRGHRGRRHALALRAAAAQHRRQEAARTLQRHWRGLCEKHLSAALMGLRRLRAREQLAARRIQAAYRAHTSRGLAQTLRLARRMQLVRRQAATDVQRMVRGHAGRAACEVERELAKLAVQARPLFTKRAKLAALVTEQRAHVDALAAKALTDEDEERALATELAKALQIRSKYHDSSRLTGTPQRFLTQYVQVQLADELRAMRLTLALDARAREALATALGETEKQLRVVQRALEPLTEGVAAQTKARRRERLQTAVRRRRRAAGSIQRVFRGFRVRCAVREGANCWLQLWATAEEGKGKQGLQGQQAPRAYYYNALTGATRWTRPLAMDIFQDAFMAPMAVAEAQEEEALKEAEGRTDSSGRDGDDEQHRDAAGVMTNAAASPSSHRSGGAWYEAFDDALQATYYFHSGMKAYQWEPPPRDALCTEQEASRRRRAWLDEQQMLQQEEARSSGDDGDTQAEGRLEALLASTTVCGARLGPWERRVEPVSGHWFFYHPGTRELRASLSPRSVHASIASGGGDAEAVVVGSARRSARSIALSGRRQRPLHWQFRYGYEYDASGRLVASAQPRPVWTTHEDPASGLAYYHNALSDEYRWEQPTDFGATYEQAVCHPNASREWFRRALEQQQQQQQPQDQNQQQQQQQQQQESSRSAGSARGLLTARSLKTRALGRKWSEYVDAETQHSYYYNEVTGETRWSLSPRSARDASDSADGAHMVLALYEQVARLQAAAVAYPARDEHMAWLAAAMADRNWAKVDALVQQIVLREQSQQAADRKSRRGVQEQPWPESSGEAATVDDDAFYEETGESRWTDPSSSRSSSRSSSSSVTTDAFEAAAPETETGAATEWQVAYDSEGNAYYYSSVTGETSWTDPSARGY